MNEEIQYTDGNPSKLEFVAAGLLVFAFVVGLFLIGI